MSKCVEYWLKLIQMPVNRYAHVCYNMLKSYDDSRKITWATHVEMLLYKHGFGHVWLLQGVGDETMFFKKKFQQRLSDCFAQDWHHDITASHKMICEKCKEIRCFYIPQCYLNPPSIHNFNKLMSTQDDNTIFQLTIFIYKLFELRKNWMCVLLYLGYAQIYWFYSWVIA